MNPGFHHIEVLTLPDGSSMIYWRMDRTFRPTIPISFYVDWSYSAGAWESLNPTAPVTDNCFYTDTIKRAFGVVRNLYYRVRANDGSTDIATSVPCQALGSLTDEEYLTGREVVRTNYVGLRKRGGKQGFLLKRREWGVPCPICADYDTLEATRGDCPNCYGVGVAGGYFPAVEYWINSQPVKRKRELSAEGVGVRDPYVRQVYGVAYPWIDATDLWVDARSNERFVIRDVSHMAEIGSKPLMFGMTLHKLPETAPEMNVPLYQAGETFDNEKKDCPTVEKPLTEDFINETPEQVKVVEAPEDLGWRRGLNQEVF